ncbi:putative transcriptional regulator [Streptomyces ambofaciens ATCC 23877]|uniref:Putative transcriptional regulator n=1 Tax=Streptomyces ambofaciens (strain ATCC 23877 / 3486 / DSM 40053 / JCM 4204 / NBRC 12836 / NRRL B-2516) TaxID=278992 RepID=A3KIE2_STRA7|nr:helix-turn-helix domain-containing protein [Streptomyces ambofaciens]AKZ53595.1 putative transcriptional regulator [Streptomyces ambofaciens ATCC 23877]CAJ89473.1 putative transcriptional regulator [Streptomyces ambofaciens ATCC 23877]
MIRLHMSAERLVGLRWAVSPVGELAAALVAVSEARTGDPVLRRLRTLLNSGHLPTLAAVTRGYTAYLPELLTPPPRTFLPPVEEQLHAVASTPTSTVSAQFTAFLSGGTARRDRCPWLGESELKRADARVRGRIEVSEHDLRERLAGELHWLWERSMAARWEAVTASFEGFVERQGAVAAREGLGGALAALHSSMRWKEGSLQIASPLDGEVSGDHPFTLVPSVFLTRIGLHAPLDRDEAQLVVPVTASPETKPVMAPVLGATRLAILRGLTEPCTTTALAARHHLTAATVSFHLSRLLAADLVRRERNGRYVHYRRTARARTLLSPAPPAGAPTAPGRPEADSPERPR